MTLLLAGCVPFAVGGAISVVGGEGTLPALCPFRLATGVPCPLCGGTRAFVFAASGDSRFLSYNAFWVFVAVAMIVMGVIMMITRRSFSRFWRPSSRAPLYLVVTLLSGGWIWSLTHQASILT